MHVTLSHDLICDVLQKYEPDHLLLGAAWADARERLTDVARLGDLLDRAAGTMLHQKLDRISPLAIPVLVLIGRETVAASDLDDMLLGELADTLAEEAMRSEKHTSEIQSLMRNSYAVFYLQKKT